MHEWMIEAGKQGIVEGVILKHYRVSSVYSVSPINNEVYLTIRRGVRIIMTKAGLPKMSDEELQKILIGLGAKLDLTPLNICKGCGAKDTKFPQWIGRKRFYKCSQCGRIGR